MQNNQSFLQWVWNNEPWMLAMMLLMWGGMVWFLRWFALRAKNAPPPPKPMLIAVLPPCAATIAAVCLWLFSGDAPHIVGRMCLLAFAGLIVGAIVATILQDPRAALWGSVVGCVAFVVFSACEALLCLKFDRELWSPERWESRAVMFVCLTVVGASFGAGIKMTQPHVRSPEQHTTA